MAHRPRLLRAAAAGLAFALLGGGGAGGGYRNRGLQPVLPGKPLVSRRPPCIPASGRTRAASRQSPNSTPRTRRAAASRSRPSSDMTARTRTARMSTCGKPFCCFTARRATGNGNCASAWTGSPGGVAEVRNLVDIVNQTDLIESPDEKTKLGQFMAHGTWSADWGALELFLLPWHRERTYPGPRGRTAAQRIRRGQRQGDIRQRRRGTASWTGRSATRGSFGLVDLGLSWFDGQSREPVLRPAYFLQRFPSGGCFRRPCNPHYEKIRQFGLDAQLTTGPWLFKLEAIRRLGASNRSGFWRTLRREGRLRRVDTRRRIRLLLRLRHGSGNHPAGGMALGRAGSGAGDQRLRERPVPRRPAGAQRCRKHGVHPERGAGPRPCRAAVRLRGEGGGSTTTGRWSWRARFSRISAGGDSLYGVRRDSFFGLNLIYNL